MADTVQVVQISKKYTFKEYVSYMFLNVLNLVTVWLLGKNDHYTLRYWFAIIMACLLIIRVPDFQKRKYHHFFAEMCYFINFVTMFVLLKNEDIRCVFPFLHGPLLLYAIFSGDAFVPHNLPRSTSFALHTFGTVVSRKILWSGDPSLLLSLDDLYAGSYWIYIKGCAITYLLWFVPYSIYVFWYKGTSMTMIKYTKKLNIDNDVSNYEKNIYLLKHAILTFISVSFGIVLMHCRILDNIMVGLQIISGLVQGGYYYYSDGKKLKIMNLFKYDKTKCT